MNLKLEHIIYVDVLIVLNLFVNYFLFLATGLFLHKKPKRYRMILGAALGSVFSLFIFFDFPFWLVTAIKLPLAALLVLVAMGYGTFAVYIKSVLTFLAVNFIFGGVMSAVWLLLSPAGMYVHNGIVYFHISALTLVVGTLVAYFILRGIGYLLNHKVGKKEIRSFMIEIDGKQVLLNGFCDTGNKLTDRTSGIPVIVCEYQSIEPLIPPELRACFISTGLHGIEQLENRMWASRIRIVPFSTIGKGGLLTAFRPDCVRLSEPGEEAVSITNILIGVTPNRLSHGEYQAVLSASLF